MINGGIAETLTSELAAFGGHGTRNAASETKHLGTLAHWMKQLQRHLLHAEQWTERMHEEFSQLVQELQSRWKNVRRPA